MITAYILRAIVIGGLIGIAASLTELALAGGRKPRRFVWLTALVLATVVPAAGMFPVDRTTTPPPGRMMPTVSSSDGRQGLGRDATGGDGEFRDQLPPASGMASAVAARETLLVPAWLQDLDRPVALLWAAASLLWIVILVGSAIRINRNRVRWREAMLDGMPVYMSHDVGPALFGLTHFGIVVPTWVEALEPARRRLVMAHEREHARAADPVTLLVGALLVLAQPLNPAAWLMFRRLRLAIEIDCDARVLAHESDVRSYGELLIDVGERTLTGAAPLAALSEGGSQLERRIAAMSQREAQRVSLRGLGALAVSAAMLLVAWKLPLVAAAASERPTRAAVTDGSAPPAKPAKDSARPQLYGPPASAPAEKDTVTAVRALTRADVPQLAETTYLALFADISPSPDVARVAREIILDHTYRQFDLPPHRRTLTNILAVQGRRDTLLGEMLRAPAERTRFWRNVAARREWVFRHHDEYQSRRGTTDVGGTPP